MAEGAVAGAAAAPWTDSESVAHVRPEVQALLESSRAYRELEPNERRNLAQLLVKVGSYLARPNGVPVEQLAAGPPLAVSQDDATEAARRRAASSPGFAGKDFQAGAVRQGVEQFGELVKKVDFPLFVSGLIQGVFKAIVDSSIQQMRAYGELLANVAKTVDQFAQDNITLNNTRDYLTSRFPDDLAADTGPAEGLAEGDGTPAPAPARLVVKGDNPEQALKKISDEMGLAKPVTDISDEQQELQLITGARLQIARQRQQLLSSMVILGINRIVVTDGLIHAKVVFDMKASDRAKRVQGTRLSDRDEKKTSVDVQASYGMFFSPIHASAETQSSEDHVTTVESSLDETSESKAQVKANLTGEVRVNFKSDYFPMEKLANPQMIAAIQGNAVPPAKPVAGA